MQGDQVSYIDELLNIRAARDWSVLKARRFRKAFYSLGQTTGGLGLLLVLHGGRDRRPIPLKAHGLQDNESRPLQYGVEETFAAAAHGAAAAGRLEGQLNRALEANDGVRVDDDSLARSQGLHDDGPAGRQEDRAVALDGLPGETHPAAAAFAAIAVKVGDQVDFAHVGHVGTPLGDEVVSARGEVDWHHLTGEIGCKSDETTKIFIK